MKEPDEHHTEATMKAVDVKILDLDWLFQDGNGRRFIIMLSKTGHETIFSTSQI